jgi:hypothetical protein
MLGKFTAGRDNNSAQLTGINETGEARPAGGEPLKTSLVKSRFMKQDTTCIMGSFTSSKF